ncbi:hypothetical protein H3S74_12175 [Gilliamella sp. W8126]|uniref:TrbM/KikA/MpfK family conjugal transfer protein n=1 Tax=Gilliamella sp. W8126 TaxID=2750946 RepID=UPI0018DDA40E|nr:TrbM/KikA/MpfK family conjugal transfer protein [Gilliamella sp. W8126]MBI0006986.1 hypothetical protein [Gilliamella sp. W8126]
MKKTNILKISGFIFLISSLTNSNTVLADADTLTGDTRTACEVILCLSSSTGKGLSECKAPLKKYFSISAKKWKDTLKKRRKFLDLCPAANENAKMSALTTALQHQEYACDAETLNSRTEIMRRNGITMVRVQSYMPGFCNDLYNHEFTEFSQIKKPKYVCDAKKWYTAKDWARGFEQVEVSRKWNRWKQEYDIKYKDVKIDKECWK